MTDSANAGNGSIATTGTNAHSADRSTRRRCLGAVATAIGIRIRSRDEACSAQARYAATTSVSCSRSGRTRSICSGAPSDRCMSSTRWREHDWWTGPNRPRRSRDRVQESMTEEQNRVRDTARRGRRCRSSDPLRARKLALQARIHARAADTAAARGRGALSARVDRPPAPAGRRCVRARLRGGRPRPTTGDPNLTLAWSPPPDRRRPLPGEQLRRCARSVSAGDPGVPRARTTTSTKARSCTRSRRSTSRWVDYDRAITTYESAMAINEPLGRRDLDAMVMGNLARIRGRRGEYLPAVSLGRNAVELSRDHAPQLVGGLLADLAEAYVGLADHASAALCFAEARADWEYRMADGAISHDRAARHDGLGGPRRVAQWPDSTMRSPR